MLGIFLDVSHTTVDNTHGAPNFHPKKLISAVMGSVKRCCGNSYERCITGFGVGESGKASWRKWHLICNLHYLAK